MSHMRQQLRETVSVRVVGLADAIRDLGTHRVCGVDVPYSRQMVYMLLKGRYKSKRLLGLIVEKRPDLLELSMVSDDTRSLARQIGWSPRQKHALEELRRRLAGK